MFFLQTPIQLAKMPRPSNSPSSRGNFRGRGRGRGSNRPARPANAGRIDRPSLPHFPAPPPAPQVTSAVRVADFSKIIDGQMKVYKPSARGFLTLYLPRVHIGVDEHFIRHNVETFLRASLTDPLLNQFLPPIARVVIQPLGDGSDFNQVFIYHEQARSVEGHNLVNKITANTFAREAMRQSHKIYITHNGRRNYWLLLPNLNPLTIEEQEVVDKITDSSDKLMELLGDVVAAGLPIPSAFNSQILDKHHVDTTWLPIDGQTFRPTTDLLTERLEAVNYQCSILENFLNQHNVPTSEDIELMDQLLAEIDEEDERIAEMHETRCNGTFASFWN